MARIHGPKVIHGAPSRLHYETLQVAIVAQLRERFHDDRRVHQAQAPTVAYVNHGRWVADCVECANGVAVDVDAGEARCCECGAVYDIASKTLRLPRRLQVEWLDDVLGARPDSRTRNWKPGERLRALWAENRRNGLPGRKAVK